MQKSNERTRRRRSQANGMQMSLRRQQKPHLCEGKSRHNPSSCLSVAVTECVLRESCLLHSCVLPKYGDNFQHFPDGGFVCLCHGNRFFLSGMNPKAIPETALFSKAR